MPQQQPGGISFAPQIPSQSGQNFQPMAPGQGFTRGSLTPEQHQQFRFAQQQQSSETVRSYLKQAINNQPPPQRPQQEHGGVPVVTVSQANQFQGGPSSTQAEHGSTVFAPQSHGPSSNLNTSGAPGSVGQLAPSSVGGPGGQHGPTSVGLAPLSQHGPTSVGGGPTSVGLAPTSVPQQQLQQQNTPQPTSVGPPGGGGGGGGPTSVGPGPTSVGLHIGSVGTHNPRSVEHPPTTYSEYPPRYFDPLTDLKSLILRDLRKSISALNEQIALAAACVQEQQALEDPVAAAYNPLSATPHSIINPQSIPPPKSIDGLKSKFHVEDYTNAYLRFFAVCDRIEARVAVLTDSYRYHNRLQKMSEVQTFAQIKSLGYATVLKPCLDSMRAERKRILGTVRELSTSLQEYRKITDEAEYCSLYSRKRRHEDVEEYSDEQEVEENEFGELVKKHSRFDEEQIADEDFKDDEDENEEEEFEEEVVEVVEYYDIPEDTVMEEFDGAPVGIAATANENGQEYESPMTFDTSPDKGSSSGENGGGSVNSPTEEYIELPPDKGEEEDEELRDYQNELVDSDTSLVDLEKEAEKKKNKKRRRRIGFYDVAYSANEQNYEYADDDEYYEDDSDSTLSEGSTDSSSSDEEPPEEDVNEAASDRESGDDDDNDDDDNGDDGEGEKYYSGGEYEEDEGAGGGQEYAEEYSDDNDDSPGQNYEGAEEMEAEMMEEDSDEVNQGGDEEYEKEYEEEGERQQESDDDEDDDGQDYDEDAPQLDAEGTDSLSRDVQNDEDDDDEEEYDPPPPVHRSDS
uniref:Uncharacterized protein n=1 Tax=Panagrolaimus superbus TaxID=310955 RepID=A0A914Y7B5_9BILA